MTIKPWQERTPTYPLEGVQAVLIQTRCMQDEIDKLRAKLKELESPDKYDLTQVYTPNCNRHPDAPHGVDEVASYYAGHPVCTCRSWKPGDAS